MQPARWIIAILVILTATALLAPPMNGGWRLAPLICDFGPSPDWVATILNRRHLISFGLLAWLAFLAFGHRPIWVPILFTIAVAAVVELEQALFASGHCRLRDMIPNLLAIAIGWLLMFLTLRLSARAFRDSM